MLAIPIKKGTNLPKLRLPHNPLAVVYLDPHTSRDMREKQYHYDVGVTVDKNVNSWLDDTRGCYNLQASEVLLRVPAMGVCVFRHITPRLATALNLPIASKQEARRLLARNNDINSTLRETRHH